LTVTAASGSYISSIHPNGCVLTIHARAELIKSYTRFRFQGAFMAWLIIKYLLTSAVVVGVSEFAKRSDRLGGFIAALPMVTVLALIWLHVENQPQEKIANHAWYTFWYVVPTLPMFLAFPVLLPRIGFWPTLIACVVLTVVCFGLFALLMKRFGVNLL
jgi:F0F1-type ATP synthase assembly protein I